MPRRKKTEEDSAGTTEEKKVLYKLVEESRIKKHTIMGALSKAGLLPQYEKEVIDSERLIIPETITQKEFDKIIETYLGGK